METEIDVHGLTCSEALRAVQRFIEKLYINHGRYFEIIHGYSHGNVLKQFFSNKNNYHSNKVLFVEPSWNEGRTCVYLKEGGEKNVKAKWCIN